MTIDGGPKPGNGYTTPDRYTPDHLGKKKVTEATDGRHNLLLPTAALRYLNAESGDMILFTRAGLDDRAVLARVVDGGEIEL